MTTLRSTRVETDRAGPKGALLVGSIALSYNQTSIAKRLLNTDSRAKKNALMLSDIVQSFKSFNREDRYGRCETTAALPRRQFSRGSHLNGRETPQNRNTRSALPEPKIQFVLVTIRPVVRCKRQKTTRASNHLRHATGASTLNNSPRVDHAKLTVGFALASSSVWLRVVSSLHWTAQACEPRRKGTQSNTNWCTCPYFLRPLIPYVRTA